MKDKEQETGILSDLYNYCRWGRPKKIENLLKNTSEEIDITAEDGYLFRIAISYEFIDILKILLQYYEKTKLQGDPHSREYLYSKTKLQDILEDALDTFSVSPEIEAIVNKYIVPKVDSDTEEESEDFLSNSSSTTFEDIPEYSSDNDAKSNDEMPVMGEGY